MKYSIALLSLFLIAAQGCADIDGNPSIAAVQEENAYTVEPKPKSDPWVPEVEINENGEDEFELAGFHITVPRIHGFSVTELFPALIGFVIMHESGDTWVSVGLYRVCPDGIEKDISEYEELGAVVTDLGHGNYRIKETRTDPETVEGLGYGPYYYNKDLGKDMLARFVQQDKSGGKYNKELTEVVLSTKIVSIY